MVDTIQVATWFITIFAAGLGLYALVAGRTSSARWLGAFFVWLAVVYARELLPLAAYENPTIWALTFLNAAGITIAFFGFAFSTFAEWAPLPNTAYRWAGAIGLVAFTLQAVAALGGQPGEFFQGPDPRPDWVWKPTDVVGVLGNLGLILVAIMHPAIARVAPAGKAQAVRGLALLSIGLSCFIGGAPAFIPQWLARPDAPWNFLDAGGIIILVLAAPAGWLYATRGAHRRLAWQTFAAIGGVFTIGSALSIYSPQIAYLPLRIIGLSLIFVAMLRGQIAGLDRTLRFTISKTTIAAIFVAVFFVASEGAQAFFGDRFQNEYFGIAAAGLLVFAISPVMRMADRLADSAVPTTAPEQQYRQALRVVVADGHISTEEEDALATLADELGLGVADVTRIRRDIQSA